MTTETLDIREIRRMLNKRLEEFGSKAAYAEHLGIRPQQLQRSFGPGSTPEGRVLEDLGLIKKTVFCKKGSTDDG